MQFYANIRIIPASHPNGPFVNLKILKRFDNFVKQTGLTNNSFFKHEKNNFIITLFGHTS